MNTTTTLKPIVLEIPKEWEEELQQHEQHCDENGVWKPCEDGACGHCVDAKTVDVLKLQLKRQGYLK
jgi:hypothetical protein